MPIREIKIYGSPVLREKAQPIENIDQKVWNLAQDMKEIMHLAKGVGLAGNQVGVLWRIITFTNPEEQKDQALINPQIIHLSEDKEKDEEGCLSFPDIYDQVERAKKVVVKGWDLQGKEVTIEGEGLLARILQHEIDHLDGILFVDRLSPTRRLLLHNKLRKISVARE
ncbi:MAG TPA: peptide deformylase [Candidatus Atribacteria bacterium]|nr:peptide deformylase [Candidatus Atribacteria bacterium]